MDEAFCMPASDTIFGATYHVNARSLSMNIHDSRFMNRDRDRDS